MEIILITIGLSSKAVESVFTEPKISSAGLASTPNGALVLESARALSEWMKNSSNMSLLVHFSKMLLLWLRTCFVQDKHHHLKKDQMWGLYHQTCTSAKFRKAWSDFLQQSISTESTPFFYLHVTDFIFKALIRIDFHVPVANSECKQDSFASLTTLKNKMHYGTLLVFFVEKFVTERMLEALHWN